MDPSAIKYINNSDKEYVETLIISQFPSQSRDNISTQSNQNLLETTNVKAKRAFEIDSFASLCGLQNESENSSETSVFSIKEELAYYYSTRNQNPSDISEYWKINQMKLPLLASAVRKYCIIPATSVPSESKFSIANYIARKERASLSSMNLRFSIILRDKPKFDKIVIKTVN